MKRCSKEKIGSYVVCRHSLSEVTSRFKVIPDFWEGRALGISGEQDHKQKE